MNLLVVGYGKMGKIITAKISNINIFNKILVVDPSVDLSIAKNKSKISYFHLLKDIPHDIKFDYVLFAIKPQNSSDIISHYSKYKSAIFLSILAGKDIKFFQSILGNNAKIARIMPNICAEVSRSYSFISYSKNITRDEKRTIRRIITAFGNETEIDESLFHKCTVIGGCFPAYIYAFCHKLLQYSQKLGFEKFIAEEVIKESLIGCAEILKNNDKASFRDLKESVTSTGGVTYTILQIMEPAFMSIIAKSLTQGINKSQHLSKH